MFGLLLAVSYEMVIMIHPLALLFVLVDMLAAFLRNSLHVLPVPSVGHAGCPSEVFHVVVGGVPVYVVDLFEILRIRKKRLCHQTVDVVSLVFVHYHAVSVVVPVGITKSPTYTPPWRGVHVD